MHPDNMVRAWCRGHVAVDEKINSATRPAWKLLLLFAGLYAAQGITGSMVQTALPTVLRDSGMPLDQLGLLYVLFLPWALKFLWAPVVDRHYFARLGARRSWLLPCQFLLAICFLIATALPPDRHFTALLVLMVFVATFAATQDIATDALAVDASDASSRGLVSGAGIFGGYSGFLIGIGLWLPIYAAFGWAASMLVMAACIGLLTVPTLLANDLDRVGAHHHAVPARPSVIAAFRRPELRSGLYFLVVYQCGVRLGISLLGPFLVDVGLSLTTIGWLKGTGGAIAGACGAMAGAWLVRRFGVRRCLMAFALLDATLLLGFAAIAVANDRPWPIVVALVLGSAAVSALTFVALYAAMMSWCSRSQTGTDFALLQSADALLAIIIAAMAGAIGQAFGHAANFAGATCCLVVAAVVAAKHPQLSGHSPTLPELPANEQELHVMGRST
jgi:MFS transporter (putative signal transducer)